MSKAIFNFSFFSLLLLLAVSAAQAQVEGLHNLLFNSTERIVRLNFDTEPPIPFDTGIAGPDFVAEGIAHYEDSDGNILFSFNSNGVYDQNNDIMPGSIGILANASAAEVGVIRIPGKSDRFYIVYNAETCSQLYFSIVDMTLNGGLGDVTDLNTAFTSDGYAEGIEFVRIPGTNDYWMLAYKCFSPAGIARFLIDESGFSTPTTLYPLPLPGGYDGRGELDFHKGKMGLSFAFSDLVFTADFDAITGELSNPTEITSPTFNASPYGLEFSPDASKMYISLWYSAEPSRFVSVRFCKRFAYGFYACARRQL